MKKHKRTYKPINQKTNDGFSNFAMNLGVNPLMDNQISQGYFDFNNYTKNRIQLEAAFRSNWLCSSLVTCVAEDVTREGFELTGEIEPSKITDFMTYFQRSGVLNEFCDGLKWGRLYGGAIGLIMTKKSNYDKEFNVNSVGENDFIGLHIFDRWQLSPDLTQLIQSGKDIGLPMYYDVLPLQLKVHHSNIIRFTGDKLPHYQAINELLWGASILENVIDRIIAFETVTMGAANLVSRAHLRTVKVEDLRQIFAMGGAAEANLVKQFQYVRQMQNNEGLTLLDKSDDFETTSYSFTGLDSMILQFVQQIAGAKRIPLPILFGQSPAGLNASGDSDIRIYYDGISSLQAKYDEPLTKLVRIMYQSQCGEPAPDDLGIKWRSLWQHTESEKADITTKTVTATIALHESGLFDRSLALKELKQLSTITGFGSNITDGDIEAEPPPEYNENNPDQTETRADILQKAIGLLNGNKQA